MGASYRPTGGAKKSRGTGSQIPAGASADGDEAASLRNEAYGTSGAAMRKTAAVSQSAADSTGPQKMLGSLKHAVSAVVDFVSPPNKAKKTQEARK